MRATLSSDGFVVDNTKPIAGVVYNTDRYHNTLWYSSSHISASWRGFVDIHSYVKEYHVALAKIDFDNTLVRNYENVGFFNTHSFQKVILDHGGTYVVLVKAVDSSGLESDVVSSIPFGFDITPPSALRCDSEDEIASGYEIVNGGFTWMENSTMEKGTFYRVHLDATGLMEDARVILRLNKSSHNLPLLRLSDGKYSSDFSFEAPNTGLITLSIIGEHKVPNNIDGLANITVYKCLSKRIASNDSVIIAQLLPNQIAVHFKVTDTESGIKYIQVGVGTTKKGFQVQPLQRVTSMHHVLVNVELPHASPLFATVVAVNHAGLRQEFLSTSVFILDHTPPKLWNIHTNVLYNHVPNGNTYIALNTTWNVSEKESEVKRCACAFGK